MLRTVVPLLRPASTFLSTSHQTCRLLSAAGASKVVELANDEDFSKAVSATKDAGLAVVDFTAKWCGPCKMMAPIYDAMSRQYDGVTFYKADIDQEPLTKSVEAHGVASVPTFAFFKGGKKVAAFSGADPNQLKRTLDDLS
ncbi:hypothetical protein WJX72_003682 [[Myrmecia] bisecta]|uniref:Thioredoxin domain-containing protein n=1 Tax=[Myrmecia] bisecta TaxID=41462 RepID=A0AAW1Q3V6_9CHLO